MKRISGILGKEDRPTAIGKRGARVQSGLGRGSKLKNAKCGARRNLELKISLNKEKSLHRVRFEKKGDVPQLDVPHFEGSTKRRS